jgi:hypothetical protein
MAKKLADRGNLKRLVVDDQPSQKADDESILHHAMGILRKRMTNVKPIEDDTYLPSSEMTLVAMSKFVDPLTYN